MGERERVVVQEVKVEGKGRRWQYNQMHVVMSASPINTHVLCVY